MPFNVSGVFSRLYNWVADRDNGIKIMAARMDGEADDVAAALNAIVSQSQPFINPIMAPNGTAGLPAYSFDSDPNLGMYRVSADVLGFAALGITALRVAETNVALAVPLRAATGTAAAPSMTFGGAVSTGMYLNGSALGFTVGGTRRVNLSSSALQIDVPVTGSEFRVNTGLVGTAVTQSDTDVTAGRLLKTGDYGLGTIISYSGNINTLGDMPTGFYRVTSGATGTKPDFASSFNMLVHRSGTSPFAASTQLAIGSGTGAQMSVRSYDGSSWSEWRLLYSQVNLLGTVSQSGGTPTGAVIQRGSNGNGEFVRFADGTQICTNTLSGGSATTASGSLYVSGDETWTFPQAFTSITGLSAFAAVMNNTRFCNAYSVSTSDATFRQFSTTSSAGTPNIRVTAIGRWF